MCGPFTIPMHLNLSLIGVRCFGLTGFSHRPKHNIVAHMGYNRAEQTHQNPNNAEYTCYRLSLQCIYSNRQSLCGAAPRHIFVCGETLCSRIMLY